MKYLKYFLNESDYNSFKTGGGFILPNVSYVVDINVVNYNPDPLKGYGMFLTSDNHVFATADGEFYIKLNN